MNWGRAKTILIILFLFINIFLIYVLVNTTKYSNTIADSTIDETIAVLNSHGIDIKKSAVPNKRHPNTNLNVVNLWSEPEKRVKRLLGEGYRVTEQDVDSYEFEYQNQNKKVVVRDDSFTYTLLKEAKPFSQPDAESARAFALGRLQKLLDGAADVYVVSEGFEDNLYHLCVGAKSDGIKIVGVNLRMTADKEDIIRMEGNWFLPDGTETVSRDKLMDVTSVLIHLVYTGQISLTGVEKVEFAYYLAEDYLKNKAVSAIPVYLVTDSNQNGHVFDARSGALIDTE